MFEENLFCTAYLAPTCYFSELINCEEARIEVHDNFNKQTLRNRCSILGPNGVQILNIPIVKAQGKQKLKDTRIAYAEDWQKNHWKSLQTAYGSAPFFEVLAPELEPLYLKKEKFLIDFNFATTELILNWLQVDLSLKKTEVFAPIKNCTNDFRFAFDAKDLSHKKANNYFQILAKADDFYPNLSIVDLMFNEGPLAWETLKF